MVQTTIDSNPTISYTISSLSSKEEIVQRLYDDGDITFQELLTLLKEPVVIQSTPWNAGWPLEVSYGCTVDPTVLQSTSTTGGPVTLTAHCDCVACRPRI